ncbi:MAG: sodium:solute symporter [Kiritimatiellales bacterium]
MIKSFFKKTVFTYFLFNFSAGIFASGTEYFKFTIDGVPSAELLSRAAPAAGEVRIEMHKMLYVFGTDESGTESFRHNPVRDEQIALAVAPENMCNFVAVPCGDAHILFFNRSAPDRRILAYHLITDRWVEIGQLPEALQAVGAVSSGTVFTVFSKTLVISGTAILTPTKYGIYDHAVVAILAVALIGFGVFFSRREKSSAEYFRAGQRIPWWAAGMSLFANGASAISLMAMPGKAFAENWVYFSMVFYILIIQLPLTLLVYVPLARRLNIVTANEYLEKRFGLSTRMLGCFIYSLNQMLARVASILLLPAIAISAIFGLSMEYSILIMGVVATIYVTLGGLEAVVWTDVLQAVVMLAAVLVCALWVLFSLDILPAEAVYTIQEMNKLKMFDFSFDWTAPVVVILFSNTVAVGMGMIGDQSFIQRVQCTPTEKDARKTIITQLAVAIPLNAVLFAMGTLLFLFYRNNPADLSPALKADGIYPFFAAQHLPPGMAGFVVAALLAATMSTVSGAVNSVANIGMEDIYRRFFKNTSDHRCVIIGKILTLILGVSGTFTALILARSNMLSIWDLALMITGIVIAPVTGIFFLGIFTKRTNRFGVWMGTIIAVLVNIYAKLFWEVHSLAFLPIGVFVTIFAGYFASILRPSTSRSLDRLTAFALFKAKEH